MSIRILLIEHNPDHILITRKILQEAYKDYQLNWTDDAKEGLNRIFQEDYDVVLCDYRMPGLNALDMLREIREKGKDLPFIVITALGSEKIAVEAMKEGAYDYVIKDQLYEGILPTVIKRSIERYKMRKGKKRAEEALRESEEKFRSLAETAPAVIFIYQDTVLRYVNPISEAITGYTREELLSMDFCDFIHPDWQSLVKERSLALQRGEKTPSRYELKVVTKSGEERWMDFFANSIEFDGKSAVLGMAYDITERKQAESALADAYHKLKETQEQLIQSAKMAAMGQLATGISHELNQPLTGIKGFAQAALMDMEQNNPLREDLQKIIAQAERMNNIIENVRFFARKSEFKMKELDINEPIEKSLMLLKQQLKVRNIRLKKSLAENLPLIKGDPNQLQQVFLNLITNAKDAIESLRDPQGGEITIKTSLSEDKKNIEITFQDTGCGISKEQLEHIFNPFFTTKSPDGGMGLGLSIVYRIVESHKGRVEVESGEGKGTTVRITLPIAVKV